MFDFDEFMDAFYNDELYGSNYELAEWCRNHVPDLMHEYELAQRRIEELEATILESTV